MLWLWHCGKIYIGETNKLRLRINLHKNQVSKKTGLNESAHIYECTKNMVVPKFQVMPLLKLKKEEINYRRNMESHFISKMKPSLNALIWN